LNIAILGLGLIGGSVGLAAAERAAPSSIVGFDPNRQASADALRIGAIDQAAACVQEAVSEADIVFAAAPVGALSQCVRLALAYAPPRCVVTDVGSTKRALLQSLAGAPGLERFIGGHPLAGSEDGGIAHARADLFVGAAWCLVKASTADGARQAQSGASLQAHRRLVDLIESFDARLVEIDAEAHDRLMARISHLPHVLANVLIDLVAAGLDEDGQVLAAAGPSFRDATRVAGANTAIWSDIYLSNADMVIAAIDEAVSALRRVRCALEAHDVAALGAWNELAHAQKLTVSAAGAAEGGAHP
jgi:prephenate dehydrogenase